MLANVAYHQAIAPIGACVTINIAPTLLHSEGDDKYLGARFLIKRIDIVAPTHVHGLIVVQAHLKGILVSHDGRVGYVVNVNDVLLRVHEQNIIAVHEESRHVG